MAATMKYVSCTPLWSELSAPAIHHTLCDELRNVSMPLKSYKRHVPTIRVRCKDYYYYPGIFQPSSIWMAEFASKSTMGILAKAMALTYCSATRWHGEIIPNPSAIFHLFYSYLLFADRHTISFSSSVCIDFQYYSPLDMQYANNKLHRKCFLLFFFFKSKFFHFLHRHFEIVE